MISDVLSDSMQRIREYQGRYPKNYDEIRAELDVVLGVMDLARAYLDDPEPEQSLKSLLLSGLKGAQAKLSD